MTVSRRQLLHLALGSATALLAGNRRVLAGSDAPADRLHWLATADSGSGDRHQFANGSAMAALHRRDPVDLVVMGGDNIYDNGDMREVGAKFERPYRELLKAGVPFHAVLGNHDIRSNNGAEQIAVRARDAGFEVVYQGIRLTPDQIVAAAVDEDVDVVGISILSGSHRELVPTVVDGLRAAGMDDTVVVVGGIIPDADADFLRDRGVAAVFTPKDYDATAIMGRVIEEVRSARGLAPAAR